MLGHIYWLAALLALVGGISGNRVAWPLLVSFVFYQLACWRDWSYDPNLWMTVDYVVMIGVGFALVNEARKPDWKLRGSDVAVVVLFAPLLASYELEQHAAHLLSMTAAIAQLVIVFPALGAWRRLTQASADMAGKDDFDLMVSA